MNAYVRSALSRVRRHPGSPERRTRDDPASRGLFDRRAHRSSLERERSLRRSSCGRQSDADLWRAVAEYRAQAQVFAEARHGEAVDAAQRTRAASDSGGVPTPATGHGRLGKRPHDGRRRIAPMAGGNQQPRIFHKGPTASKATPTILRASSSSNQKARRANWRA